MTALDQQGQASAGDVPEVTACANCGTHLEGPYCHACGQKAHLHHKLSHLIEEFAEGLAHFDGRFWRTLPLLVGNPGRLSREWRLGRRQRFVAPIAAFLFSVFLVFVVPGLTGNSVVDFGVGEPAEEPGSAALSVGPSAETEDGQRSVFFSVGPSTPEEEAALERFMEERLSNPEYLGYKMETLAYKLSFAIVPLSMLSLWLLMAWPGGFSLYDHAVVALYGLSFAALLVVIASIIPFGTEPGVGLIFAGIAAGHSILHLKGAYGLSWIGAVVRGFFLAILTGLSFLVFTLLIAALGILG